MGGDIMMSQEEAIAVFPAEELKQWYASLSIEAKLAAVMMLYLPAHSPDCGKTGEQIHAQLEKEVFEADLPPKLQDFRRVYCLLRNEFA
jgi:hypothetical protein